MQINALPDDIDTLKRFILERDATVAQLQQQLTVKQQESVNLSLLIEKLKLQIARFKRTPFGPSSERYPGELMQLEWWVDDLQANQAQTRVAESDQPVPLSMPPAAVKDQPRRTLPPHLPRQRIEHLPSCTCSNCGATMVKIGEDVSDVLEYVPASFKVIRPVRPKLACQTCQTIVQLPAPSRPIDRGLPGPGLLAHVRVSKYGDHCVLRMRPP